jgi:energy-converting hydrogenase Eha subunit E
VLAVALACFAFVAWSWSELHELMQAEPIWREFYAAGRRLFLAPAIAPRLVVLFGAMATGFAMVAAWSADAAGRKRLARIGLAARLVSSGGAVWVWQAGFSAVGSARAWLVVLAGALAVEAVGWAFVLRANERALAVVTGAGTSAMIAAVVVREAPRVALIEPTHTLAVNAGGAGLFALALVVGIAAITWVVRVTRS